MFAINSVLCQDPKETLPSLNVTYDRVANFEYSTQEL